MLTRKQQQVWEIIQTFTASHDYAPTLDEIAQASGINTRSTIHQHVQVLIREGYLEAATGKRAYQIPAGALPKNLPLVGRIAAGKPIAAIEGHDQINPTDIFSGNGRYVLEVCGESMIGIGIMDKDYVVIQQQAVARDGEVVVALVEREEATLKRIYHLPDGQIELRPENSQMQPQRYPAESVQVQGRMVGLFRNYG